MNIEILKFLVEQRESVDMVLDLLPVPVFIKDIDGRYLACNVAFEEFIGIKRKNLIGNGVYDLWDKERADIYYAKDKELYDNPGLQVYESTVSTPDSVTFVQFHKETFSDTDGNVAGLLGVIFDRTAERNLENELKQLAQVDNLTGLLNRRAGSDALNRLLAEASRNKKIFSVAMLDIDLFKSINDTYGHEVGDQVLATISHVTASILREYDFIYRYGGEEFTLCFPDTNIDDAKAICERLRIAFEQHKVEIASQGKINITVSIGIASYPQHGSDIKTLTKAADKALYEAKNNGRNTVVLADQ